LKRLWSLAQKLENISILKQNQDITAFLLTLPLVHGYRNDPQTPEHPRFQTFGLLLRFFSLRTHIVVPRDKETEEMKTGHRRIAQQPEICSSHQGLQNHQCFFLKTNGRALHA